MFSLKLMWLIGSDGFLPRFPREHHSTYCYPGKKIKIQNTISNECKLHSLNPRVRNKNVSQAIVSQEPLISTGRVHISKHGCRCPPANIWEPTTDKGKCQAYV